MLLAIAAITIGFTSCASDNDPFFTAGEDDYPRILNTDIPEMAGGKPSNLPTISRDQNFKFTVIVTPTQYTTVTWEIDGEKVHEGTEIDMPMLAGDHTVKIIATTTKGLSTFRNCTLKVLPCEGDPTLANDAKSRWLNPGTTATISGQNLEGVTGAEINGVAVANFVNNGGSISFEVPQMENGEYNIVLVTADMKYGCDKVTVTDEKWVEPGVETIVLFEGDKAVPEWTCENMFSDLMKELVEAGRVKAGTPLTIEFERTAEDYCSIVLINGDWNGILTGGNEKSEQGRGDYSPEDGQTVWTVNLPEIAIDMIKANGFYLTGHGYQIKKVSVEVEALGLEKVLYEGSFDMPDWSAQDLCNEKFTSLVSDGTIKPGTVVNVYGKKTAADYCSVAIINNDWESIITGEKEPNRGDLDFGDGDVVSFTIGEAGIECVKKSGFYLAGHGYTLTKITVK